ncbi:MAG: hypothetical protein Q9210_005994, partial [Variospora velana]
MKQETFYPSPKGDETNGGKYLGAAWALVTCAFSSTAVRIWVRGRLTRNMGWDDYHMIIGQFTNLVGLGLVTAEVFNGLGRHMYYLQPDQIRRFIIIGWLDWMQTFITIMLTKISICLFLLRIKNDVSNKIFMYILITANVVVTSVICFLLLGICQPLRAYWDVGVDGQCFSTRQFMIMVASQGTFSILSDLILATMPLFFLRNLQISRRTKLLLCVLMGAGYITAACSLVRTVLSPRVLSADLTWADLTTAAWRAVEVNLGIICANAPIARPLYLYYKGRLRLFQETTNDATTNNTAPSSSSADPPSSRWRFWSKKPCSKGFSERQKPSQAFKETHPGNQRTDTTLTSVEMGLPIQGFVMNGGGEQTVDLEE